MRLISRQLAWPGVFSPWVWRRRATQAPAEPPKAVVAAAEPATPAALEVGACQACHETAFSKPFLKSHHAGLEKLVRELPPGGGRALRGDAGRQGQRPPPSITKLKAAEINATCLGCHEKGKQANWQGGVHDRRGLSCTTCHAVHDYKSEQHQLKTARDPETCYTCHAAIRAKSLRTSHHPVREGLMTCATATTRTTPRRRR